VIKAPQTLVRLQRAARLHVNISERAAREHFTFLIDLFVDLVDALQVT
jgi:hypothetical protein